MKKLGFSVKAIGLFWIFILLGACSIEDEPTDDSPYGLGKVLEELEKRVGKVRVTDNQEILDAAEDFDEDLIANYQYAYKAINDWCGSSPAPVKEGKVNMKSLLKMIDEVNQDRTNYGVSVYATEQVVDKKAVDVIVTRLWLPYRLFVVLSGGNVISYSVDAENWHEAGSPSSFPEYRDIVYGEGKFVVVENNPGKSSSIYSFDGHNWFVGSDSNVRMSAVAYGNGKFAGINDGYNGYVSGDGVSWQSVSIPKDGGHAAFSDLIDIAYGDDDGKFVAIQSSGDKLASGAKLVVTTNGVDWEWKGVLPSAGDWQSINYESGKFVVIGKGGKIAVSTDGVEWDEVVTDASLDLVGLAYDGVGKFVALSSSGRVITSTDGIKWTESVALKDEDQDMRGGDSIVYGAGKFVAVAGHFEEGETVQSSRIAISTDGVNWKISHPLGNRDSSRIMYVEDIKGMDG